MLRPHAQGSGSADDGPLELADWLRPAQAGVALGGNARAAHIAATLIDLEIRGYLSIEETGDEDNSDWLLTRRAGTATDWRRGHVGSRRTLLRYERTLLRGLPRHQRAARLSRLNKTKRWAKAIRQAYRQLDREAIARGWMGASRSPCEAVAGHDRAEGDGAEGTLDRLRAFRRYLNGFQPVGTDAWASFREYLPYAVAFGLTPEWAQRFAGLQPPAGAAINGHSGSDTGLSLAADLDKSSLGTAFAGAVCTHVHSVASHSGYAGSGSHHGGGFSHGHGGGFGGGGHH